MLFKYLFHYKFYTENIKLIILLTVTIKSLVKGLNVTNSNAIVSHW